MRLEDRPVHDPAGAGTGTGTAPAVDERRHQEPLVPDLPQLRDGGGSAVGRVPEFEAEARLGGAEVLRDGVAAHVEGDGVVVCVGFGFGFGFGVGGRGAEGEADIFNLGLGLGLGLGLLLLLSPVYIGDGVVIIVIIIVSRDNSDPETVATAYERSRLDGLDEVMRHRTQEQRLHPGDVLGRVHGGQGIVDLDRHGKKISILEISKIRIRGLFDNYSDFHVFDSNKASTSTKKRREIEGANRTSKTYSRQNGDTADDAADRLVGRKEPGMNSYRNRSRSVVVVGSACRGCCLTTCTCRLGHLGRGELGDWGRCSLLGTYLEGTRRQIVITRGDFHGIYGEVKA